MGLRIGYCVAMFGPRALVRPLLAAPFIIGAVNALRAPEAPAAGAERVGVPIAAKLGLPTDPVALVKLNGAVQLAAGVLLAFGKLPRLASIALAASLVPTTLAGHRFWDEKDPGKRKAQLIQFAKNAGMLGGLLSSALDTGGRPSVFWSGRRAAGRAADSVTDVAQSVAGSVGHAYHTLPGVS